MAVLRCFAVVVVGERLGHPSRSPIAGAHPAHTSVGWVFVRDAHALTSTSATSMASSRGQSGSNGKKAIPIVDVAGTLSDE